MNKGHIYFEIQADDPSWAVGFYSRVFDWKFDEVKGLPISYWRIETGGSRGGLLQRPVLHLVGDLARRRLCAPSKWRVLTALRKRSSNSGES
jgi:predicted enzyme related to lactoylglutathione lyase